MPKDYLLLLCPVFWESTKGMHGETVRPACMHDGRMLILSTNIGIGMSMQVYLRLGASLAASTTCSCSSQAWRLALPTRRLRPPLPSAT